MFDWLTAFMRHVRSLIASSLIMKPIRSLAVHPGLTQWVVAVTWRYRQLCVQLGGRSTSSPFLALSIAVA